MSDSKKAVFISYRRHVSSFIARSVFQKLREYDYDVFMDVESIDSGTFDTIILNQIEARQHFLVILTPGTVERCIDPGDWLRREIEYAITKQRNIVPLLVNNFSFTDAEPYLIGNLKELKRYNAVTVYHEFFEEAIEKLCNRFLKQPALAPVVHTPILEVPIVQRKIEEVVNTPISDKLRTSEELYEQGHKKWQEGVYKEAVTLCTDAIKLNPVFAEAFNRRGAAYYRLGEYALATYDYDAAIKINPEYADAFNGRGAAFEALGNLGNAIKDYTEAIRLNPEFADAYYNRAAALLITHDRYRALSDLSEVIRINPSDTEAYLRRGELFHHNQEWDKALSDFSEAIRLNAQNPKPYLFRAAICLKSDDFTGAIRDYSAAIGLGETNPEVLLNRGIARIESGDYEGAIEDCSEAIRLGFQRDSVFNVRGSAYFLKNDFDNAIQDFTIAINCLPKFSSSRPQPYHRPFGTPNPPVSFGLSPLSSKTTAHYYDARGQARARKMDIEGAIDDFTQAITYDSKKVAAYNDRGELLFSQGKYDLALADYQKAKSLLDDEYDELAHDMVSAGIAITYSALGEVEEAERLWRELVEKDTHYLDTTWVKKTLNWADPLVEEAQKLILKL